MRAQKWMVFIFGCLFSVAFTAGQVWALQIDTAASYRVTFEDWSEDPPVTVEDDSFYDNDTGSSGIVYSEAPSGMISSTEPFANIGAGAKGNAGGYIAAHAEYLEADGQDYEASASVHWEKTYTTATAGDYTWDFTITGGELSIQDYCSGPTMNSSYHISISSNGSVVFESAATLEGGQPGYTYTEFGTDIGGTAFNENYGGYLGYRYNFYQDSLDLGTFAVGDAITIAYLLEVDVAGPGYETGAKAFIGDPGDFSGGSFYGNLNGGGSTPPSTVPEPSTILLLSCGLLGLMGCRRHAKKS